MLSNKDMNNKLRGVIALTTWITHLLQHCLKLCEDHLYSTMRLFMCGIRILSSIFMKKRDVRKQCSNGNTIISGGVLMQACLMIQESIPI
jgi:hypothetical protein